MELYIMSKYIKNLLPKLMSKNKTKYDKREKWEKKMVFFHTIYYYFDTNKKYNPIKNW